MSETNNIREESPARQALEPTETWDHRLLTQIFRQAPAFLATLRGPNHVIVMTNPAYEHLMGHSDVIGKPFAEAMSEIADQGLLEILERVYQTGEPFVANGTRLTFPVQEDGPPKEWRVDFTYQPLFAEEGMISGILIYGVDRTQQSRLEQEQARLLEQQRRRAEREALLNKIGAAVRSTWETEVILQETVSLLGQALEADRCYFVRYNEARDTVQISPEWIRSSTPQATLVGRTRKMSTYFVDRDPNYKPGTTHIVDDVSTFAPEDAARLITLGVGALLRVPVTVGNQRTFLGIARQERHHWTAEEIRLVEDVATLVHSTLESALSQQREHNIALQLQDALIPPVPVGVPGLLLASFYRPALAEASVGGDFFDVFSVGEGCSALVVADLSGKGLAAASQVATVRNMLRFSLYNASTLAEAMTTLHRTLVKQELLTGFATLFVGLYDEKEQALTYVNCGQEPGLIWRAATGRVERMRPTGPVLGGFGAGDFEERAVSLASGDIIALFTDGLTEVGPSRKVQLEIDGVSNVLWTCCNAELSEAITPQAVVDCLIAGVDDFARGGARDDIALLVGVVGAAHETGEEL